MDNSKHSTRILGNIISYSQNRLAGIGTVSRKGSKCLLKNLVKVYHYERI